MAKRPRKGPAAAAASLLAAQPPVRTYAARRPFAMVDDLSTLTGPVEGTVELPVVLDWSPKRAYDLCDEDDRHRLYEAVLNEAMNPEDLQRFLNRELLIEAWPHLILPGRVKSRWEAVFPELALRSRVGQVGV